MVKKVRKHKCSKCGKMATWLYMPSTKGRYFYCDDCVPRGCECNVYNIKDFPKSENGITQTIYWNKEEYEKYFISENHYSNEEVIKGGSPNKKDDSLYYEILDDFGRREPCCEFVYSNDGFELEIPEIVIKKRCLLDCIAKVRNACYLHSTNIDWCGLIKFICNEYGENVNYHIIFNDIANYMVKTYKIIYSSDIVNLTNKKIIVSKFIDEIRKIAYYYTFKQYDGYEDNCLKGGKERKYDVR